MNRTPGFGLLCDDDGYILEVLYNSLEYEIDMSAGMLFSSLAAPGSLAKFLSFMVEVRAFGAAFDWEVNIQTNHGLKPIRLVGGSLGEKFFFAGSDDAETARKLYEELIRINNEQTNTLRKTIKENSYNSEMYDEISRLNNELVSAQRELSKKNAELARLNEEKNRFLGMAAHDLRNPLHSILMHAEFLLEDSVDPTQREFLSIISTTSQSMANLVDDLLDVARIESGKLNLDLSVERSDALINRVAAVNGPLAKKKGVTIAATAEESTRILIDVAKIEQVLNNLIGNALKFSSPGGKIEIRCKNVEEGVLITVKDEGAGIAPEQQAKLFQPFQRGQKGTAGETSTGLGLVIVKRIVEGHRGKIWFESEVGKGTLFFVYLPSDVMGEGSSTI